MARFIILLLGFLIACTATDKTDSQNSVEENNKIVNEHVATEFEKLIVDVPIIRLPDSLNFENVIGNSSIQASDNYIPSGRNIYGYFAFNDKYAIIYLERADYYLAMLRTFDRNGNIIDTEQITMGYCGSDCGFYCNEYYQIDSDFRVLMRTEIVQYTCDEETDEELESSKKEITIIRQGQITQVGQIILSEEERIEN